MKNMSADRRMIKIAMAAPTLLAKKSTIWQSAGRTMMTVAPATR